MPKSTATMPMRRSVFARLMATMIAVTLVVVLCISAFFSIVAGPVLRRSVDTLAEEYIDLLTASAPDLPAAQRVARRLGIHIRYEGPHQESWSTSPNLPTIAQFIAAPPDRTGMGSRYGIGYRSDGGAYLYSFEFLERLRVIHCRLLALVIVLVVLVIGSAHMFLRHLLRPLRWLQAGVTTLSEGNLDVKIDKQPRDEFGVLIGAFNDMVGRVRSMVRSRDQLLIDVSHELRSPLTRMKVGLALCDESVQHRLSASVTEMEGMVTELLELERLRNDGALARQPYDLAQLVRDIAGEYSHAPGIKLSALPKQVVVPIDPDRASRVLINLIDNAFKYSLADSRPVDISVAESDESVVIRVADDGTGIPEADLPNLFVPFFRVDRSRARTTGGYGLGLSLCKKIMEAHGGTIEAKSNAGRGACFLVTFPKHPSH